MSDNLIELILSLTPEDGSSIGNGAMLALLREHLPSLTDEDYVAARDELVDGGVLGRGRGRGGSIYRADVADLTLESPDEAQPAEPPGRVRSAKKGGNVRRSGEPIQVLSYRHGETRVNNPEVGMVHAETDPDRAKTKWAYDPHLDPVLNFDSTRAGVENLIDNALASNDPAAMKEALAELKRLQAPYLNWTGKAERTSFEVDTVSLHVHERVDPATILANAARRLKGKDAGAQWRQADLFAAPFENLPLRQALDFYSHEKGWSNRLVSGDSLLVMNSLLTKESMGGKVQMIYIDPPYGIKYGSNFQPFVSKRDVKDRSDDDLTQEPEMIRAFRDTWELGIHSYLNYLRDRLLLAKELLSESGSVFVQISDENVHHIKEMMDELFGSDNFISLINVTKTSSATSELLSSVSDYLVWYGKDRNKMKYRQLYFGKEVGGKGGGQYNKVQEPNGVRRPLRKAESVSPDIIPADCRVYRIDNMTSQRPPGDFPVAILGKEVRPSKGYWKTGEVGVSRLKASSRIELVGKTLSYVRFIDDFSVFPVNNNWADTGASGFGEEKRYVVQTLPRVIERCVLMTTDPGDLVLDPTCGSGTTAYVAERWGRRWITCDTSRVAITLAKQRLMTASFDYFALRYPQEGLKGGFDYETVPHITLKSIATNSDIDAIYGEEHPNIVDALDALNSVLVSSHKEVRLPPFRPSHGVRKDKPLSFEEGECLYEWEVPFHWPVDGDEVPLWPADAREPFDAFHAARQAMQRRIDQSIADHAEQETLYDKPRKDPNRLRITGPFSVEAVPAPTVLSLDDSLPPIEADDTIARTGETSRQSLWRNELLKTGVRAKGGAILRFAEFETLPGLRHLHASGYLVT